MRSAEIVQESVSAIDTAANAIQNWNVTPRNPALSRIYPRLSPMIGTRVTGNDLNDLEGCSVDDTLQLIETVAHTVLIDEHTRTPLIYALPFPNEPYSKKALSLDQIRFRTNAFLGVLRKFWPVPKGFHGVEGEEADEPTVFKHEIADNHIIFMALNPREMQDAISEAVAYNQVERADIMGKPADHPKGRTLKSPHDNVVNSPFGDVIRYEGRDAIKMIDEVSDNAAFLGLMERLLELKSADERDQFVHYYIDLIMNHDIRPDYTDGDSEPNYTRMNAIIDSSYPRYMATQVRQDLHAYFFSNMDNFIQVANFNMRYRGKGRNMTEAEMLEAGHAYIMGMLRVAHKLAGDYQEQTV
ncbi:MAG TPA: hypothetical protein VMB52_04395 [Verrucomicrobiae bacterium]|nr:hypothetical protein [Verrucomicrobiae bacterium]